MGVQGDFDLHFWILRGMARHVGVNPGEAMRLGALSQAEYDEMLDICRACGRSATCLALLSERQPGAEVLQGDCPIKGRLEALRAWQ